MVMLASASAVAATVWAPVAPPAVAASPVFPHFTEQLPVPAAIDATTGAPVALTELAGKHKFSAKQLRPTPTWGYVPTGTAPSDVYLGPTIEARRGVPVTVTVKNSLKGHPLAASIDTSIDGVTAADLVYPRTTTHLHGGHVPPGSDGGPESGYRIGAAKDRTDYAGGTGQYTYRYPNDQEATTLWYHDHAVGITRLNVQAGLAGFYLLRDQYDTGRAGNPLGLPAGYGTYEIPLVLQDRSFNSDGTLAYPGAPWEPEFFGDVATVNGKAWPDLAVDRGLYRLRLLNGSNSRFYHLTLGAPLYLIGTDGGLLNAPLRASSLLLAPGERADVLADFRDVTAGTGLVLRNVELPEGVESPAEVDVPEIMRFTVGTAAGFRGPVPATLRGGPGQPAVVGTLPPATVVRNVMLNEIIDPATDMPTMSLLNNRRFDTTQIEQPRVDTVEYWRIVNTTADTHPIHLHLVQFQPVRRQAFDVDAYVAEVNARLGGAGLPDPSAAGLGPSPVVDPTPYLLGTPRSVPASEAGWKDTVQAHPGEVLTIRVPFGGTAGGVTGAPFTASFTGRYVWHCHILEHEDNEMMLPYEVRP
jgi:FtsP/CotA-like multicopper oxidase with cupredoxin domain